MKTLWTFLLSAVRKCSRWIAKSNPSASSGQAGVDWDLAIPIEQFLDYRLLITVLLLINPHSTLAEIELNVAFPNLRFTRPVDLQHPSDDTDRLFVVEQRGVILVFENRSDVRSKTVFLDIEARVNDSGNEEGLLGLAFHPNYAANGFFYLNYTASSPRRTVIARYSVSPADPNRADRNSESVILEVAQPFGNHNGGQLQFGPDGFLYIGMGDGGSSGDPFGHGQNLTTLLGTMLRIDVDRPSGGRNYSIPPENPFIGNRQGIREEIYAYGLRNPWRYSFDPGTNLLWAADVGQNAFEEIDIIERGKNYGWNIMEGEHCFNPRVGCDDTGLEAPLWEYPHSLGRSITGGYVYRGRSLPELVGDYIYGDFVTGRIWALRFNGINPPQNRELFDTSLGIASFGVDKNNELYLCAFDDRIYTFAAPPPTITGIEPTNGATTGNTQITITGTNFVSGAAVTVDGKPAADVTVLSDTQITAITPEGNAGTVDVDVINPDGKTATIAFRYDAPQFLPWDVNKDGTVDIFDLVLVAKDFGGVGMDLASDVNGDGATNIFDLVLVARNFSVTGVRATRPR